MILKTLEAKQTASQPDLDSYDIIAVAFSGGKDSLACLLHLLELGVDKDRIELWHHDVDGHGQSNLMDWPCTASYCRAVAAALGVKIYFSWKDGGFEREMNRDEQRTAPVSWEEPQADGSVMIRSVGGNNGKPSTRQKFPQVSADLSVRWCSAYLKVDVCRRMLANDIRFVGKRTLVLTGERAEESSSRAKYKTFEPHVADLRDGQRAPRHIDAWRAVHSWSEAKVWAIIEKFAVVPHPAYRIGWGRVSCAACIFGSANQWASLTQIDPTRVARIAEYEKQFGLTIKRGQSVTEQAAKGTSYEALESNPAVAEALDPNWNLPAVLGAGQNWELPAGAFGESAGPV